MFICGFVWFVYSDKWKLDTKESEEKQNKFEKHFLLKKLILSLITCLHRLNGKQFKKIFKVKYNER